MNMPSMTWVSTFGLTVACGNSPLSDFSTFNEAVLNTGGARLLLFVSVFEVTAVASDELIFVVVVAGFVPKSFAVVIEMVPISVGAVDRLTVTATVDEVTAADEADVTDVALDVVTGAPTVIFSLTRDCDSFGFGDAFTFDAAEFACCDTLVGVALIRSVNGNGSINLNSISMRVTLVSTNRTWNFILLR